MKELKQILVDRINNILELKEVFQNKASNPNNKYDYIVDQKRTERIRSLRQNDLLIGMSNLSTCNSATEQEIFNQSVQICGLYDPQFLKFKFTHQSDSLRKLYVEFFNTHSFQEKGLYINHLLERDKSIGLSPALFFGWLSEWSKKIYCQILQKQIEKSFSIKEKSPKSLSNSFTLGLIENKSKKCLIENGIELSEISLSNRPNIHSFFIQQLQAYYRLTGIEGVDSSYLKTIRKRFQKQEFIKPNNLSKAASTLIQCTANKQISNIMKAYESQYLAKFPKSNLRQSAPKLSDPAKKLMNYSPIKKKPRHITDSDETSGQNNKILSPKLSELQFRPEDFQNKFRRIKIISHFKSIRNNIEFPGISFKKEDKLIAIDKNMFRTAKNRQEVIASLQNRLKEKDFLKCQSILSKYKLKNDSELFNSKAFSSQICSPSIEKKVEMLQLESDYDDNRIKISKMFELADLRVNKKYNIRNKYLAQQPA